MKQSHPRRKSGWFWVGVALLPVVALLWFALVPAVIAEPDIANIIIVMIFLTLLTAVPVGIMAYGVYGVRNGTKESAVEVKLGPEPAYPPQPAAKPAQTYTGFFGRRKEKHRDKTIDKLCDDLCAMGLDARMVEGRRREEKMIWFLDSSLGLVEIRDSPIRYENVRRHIRDQYGSYDYKNVYLVPDTRVPKGGYLQLKSVRVKSVPVFGRVVDLRWEAKFVKVGIKSLPTLTGVSVPVKMDSNLIRRVSEDISVKETLIGLNEDITIRSLEDWGWAISTSATHERQPAPSRKQWDCYETIAHHLLESELSDFI